MDPALKPPSRRPTITVGMPVYNGARHIASAIDSMLAQTYEDFDLIVTDNASTDESAQIVEAYMSRDPRVRLVRHPRNIGSARNWNSLVPLARSPYFKWASSNDLVAPSMLADCLRALEDDPSLVLCNGRTVLIDEGGNELGPYDGDIAVVGRSASERYEHVRTSVALNNLQSGLIRTEVLRRTLLERVYPGGDMVFIAELALYGSFCLLPQMLFYRRIGGQSSTLHMSETALREFWDPGAASRRARSTWRMHADHAKAIMRAPIPAIEQYRAMRLALRYARWDRGDLWRELLCHVPGLGKGARG